MSRADCRRPCHPHARREGESTMNGAEILADVHVCRCRPGRRRGRSGARGGSRLESSRAGPRKVGPAPARRCLPRRHAADRPGRDREGRSRQGRIRARVVRGVQTGGGPRHGHGRPGVARSGGAGGDVRPPERWARGHRRPQPPERNVAARDVHALHGPRRGRPAREGAAPGIVREWNAPGRRSGGCRPGRPGTRHGAIEQALGRSGRDIGGGCSR